MAIHLAITPCNDNFKSKNSDLGKLSVYHKNCDDNKCPKMEFKPNPIADINSQNRYSLRCSCGLHIEFNQKAELILCKQAIDEVQTTLPIESYTPNDKSIVISTYRDAKT